MLRSLSLLILAGALSGCVAQRLAPDVYQRTPRIALDEPKGAWAVVDLPDNSRAVGELLAISPDSLYLLTWEGVEAHSLVALRARVEAWNGDHTSITAWGGIGMLSALTHGFALMLSVPVWGAFAAEGGRQESLAGYEIVPRRGLSLNREGWPWDEAVRYARFPQGLPEGLDRSTLRLGVAPFQREGLRSDGFPVAPGE